MNRRPRKERIPPPQLPEGQPDRAAEADPPSPLQESLTLVQESRIQPAQPPQPARRDGLGFPTDAQPHVTAAQLRWLTYRLEAGDNAEACTLSGDDPLTVLQWLGDPEFFGVYQAALENKREGFKALTAHLLPAVLRSLDDLLRTGSNKDKKEAAALILRAQGLLVDKPPVADPGAISALFALLRQDQPVEARVLDMATYRSLEPGEG